nr:MAG TPA: hypothetical protein [Caudoviricetes sp.]
MKEGYARLNTITFHNNKNFLFINNIRLIHFLLEDFHYEP